MFTEYGCASCGPMAMMNENKISCACEADVLGSLSCNILNQLNDKELEILAALATGNELKNIANDINISYKTAANYQTSIKQKLKLKTSMELYRIAKDNGLVD